MKKKKLLYNRFKDGIITAWNFLKRYGGPSGSNTSLVYLPSKYKLLSSFNKAVERATTMYALTQGIQLHFSLLEDIFRLLNTLCTLHFELPNNFKAFTLT